MNSRISSKFKKKKKERKKEKLNDWERNFGNLKHSLPLSRHWPQVISLVIWDFLPSGCIFGFFFFFLECDSILCVHCVFSGSCWSLSSRGLWWRTRPSSSSKGPTAVLMAWCDTPSWVSSLRRKFIVRELSDRDTYMTKETRASYSWIPKLSSLIWKSVAKSQELNCLRICPGSSSILN